MRYTLYIADVNFNHTTHQFEMQFSNINIFNVEFINNIEIFSDKLFINFFPNYLLCFFFT